MPTLRKYISMLLAMITISVVLSFWVLACSFGKVYAAESISPVANLMISGSSIPSSGVVQENVGIDPTILGAIVIIIAALITSLATIYQTIYSAKISRKSTEIEASHRRELERLRRELDEQSHIKTKKEQQEASTIEAIRHEMLLVESMEGRAKAYRRALHADPHISRMQILDMSRPLEVTNAYVRVRVHEDTKLHYGIHPLLKEAEEQRDPNAIFRARLLYLESRAHTALDPEEAIRKYKRCVILGDPGAGKTTLLKFLTLGAADGKFIHLPDLPIHIELNAFADSPYNDLLDFAASIWDERYAFIKENARRYMEGILSNGQALFLLDALDETMIGEDADAAQASYSRVSRAIVQVATRYPLAPIVVTARKAGYKHHMPLAGFTELEVVDFRVEDMKQFIINWFKNSPTSQQEVNAADLNMRLERNLRIQALASNPLLLSLIALVYEAQLELPDRRTELYKRCIDVLLTEWDARRNIRRRREFKPEHKRQLLTELAWHFHNQGLRYFPEREVLAITANFLPALGLQSEESHQVLQEIANENGLLKEQAKGWYGFIHLTLQEYFVAQYVNDHSEIDILLTHCRDPWWEEIQLLYAGLTYDASPLLLMLLGKTDARILQDDMFYTNIIMAGRCLAAHPTVRQVALRDEIITRLFNILTTVSYVPLQKQVAEVLVEIGGRLVIMSLLRLLSDKEADEIVRGHIAIALGTLKTSEARSLAPKLLSLLTNEQVSKALRWDIADALGILGERSVALPLLGLLEDEYIKSDVRSRIAIALGVLGETSVVPRLLQILKNGKVENAILSPIAGTLGVLGERSVIPDLLELLSNEQVSSSVRGSIAAAIGNLHERSVVSDLLTLLENRQINSNVRACIADTLGTIGEQSIIPMLVKLLKDGQIEQDVRCHITTTLGILGMDSVVNDLLHLIIDEQVEWDVRCCIADALGTLGEQSAIPCLLQLLSDDRVEWDVRGHIAIALGTLKEQSALPDLLKLLSNGQIRSSIRGRIAATLGMQGEQSIVPELLKLLKDKRIEWGIRGRIAIALGNIGDRSIVPDFLQLLSDEQIERDVRGSIVAAIDRLTNDEETIYTLVKLLPTIDVADAVYNTLAKICDRMGVRVFVTYEEKVVKECKIVHW